MNMRLILLLAAASTITAADEPQPQRYYNSTPVRLWPVLEVLDYGQPPTKEVEVLWPLFDRLASQDRQKLHMFPFLWYGRRPDDRYLFVAPVYGHRRTADSHADLFFPLFSTIEGRRDLEPYALVPHVSTMVDTDREKSLRVLGPVLRVGKGNPHTTTAYAIGDLLNLGPILRVAEWRKSNTGRHTNLLSIFPFRLPTRAPKPGTNTEALSLLELPVFRHRSTEQEGKTHLFPVFFRSRTPDRSSFFVPLLLSGRDVSPQRSKWNVLWFIAGHRLDVDGNGRFRSFRTHIFPFYWRGRDPRVDYLYLWPAFTRHHKTDGDRTYSVAWPLLIWGHNPKIDERFAGFPFMLAGYARSPKRWGCWAVPAGVWEEGKDEHFRMITPLYLDMKEGKTRARWILPLHASFRQGETYRRDFVLGNLFGYARDTAKDMKHYDLAWPIAATETGKDHTHHRILPVWWHWQDRKERWDLFLPPLFYHHRGPLPGHRSVVSFPFLWYSRLQDEYRDRSSLTLFPLLWLGDNRKTQARSTVLFPLFWRFNNDKSKTCTNVVFPLLWHKRTGDPGTRRTVLFPLLWHKSDHVAKTRSTTLFPLVWHRRDDTKTRRSLTVFPLLFYSRDDRRPKRGFVLFPVLWYNRNADKRTYCLWPLAGYSKSANVRSYSTLWPFFRYWRNRSNGSHGGQCPFPLVMWKQRPKKGYSHVHALPYWSTKTKNSRFTTFAPLIWYRRHEGFAGTGWLWPIGKPRDKSIVSRHVALWKLMSYERRKNGDFDFRVLHKLVRRRRKANYSESCFNPLVRSEHDAGTYRFSLLGPTIQYEREAGERRLRLLHAIKIPLPRTKRTK